MQKRSQVHALPIQHYEEGLPLKLPNGQWCTWDSCPQGEVFTPHHLYKTSDEEIKEGDWYIAISQDERRVLQLFQYKGTFPAMCDCRKIVATTNPDLHTTLETYGPSITNIAEIGEDFIKAFVEAQGIWEVMVEYEENNFDLSKEAGQLLLKLNPDGTVIWKPVATDKESKLEILKSILERANVRQYLNINNFGYSQVERDIVDALCS